jgi:hypothetical protein
MACVCICGDFNFNKTEWDSDNIGLVKGGLSVPDHAFLETLDENHIHQSVTFPTFQNASGKRENYLDLLLSESPLRVNNVEEGPPLSDDPDLKQYHIGMTFDVSVRGCLTKPTFERSSLNYSKGDYVRLSAELEAVQWEKLFKGKSVDECNNIFVDQYERACKLWIPPSNKLKRKVQPPWMTAALATLIAKKKRLWIIVQRTSAKVASVRNEYKSICKQIKKGTKRAVIDHEKELISDKKNSKRLYQYVKSKQKTHLTQ